MKLNFNFSFPGTEKKFNDHYNECVKQAMKAAILECERQLIIATPVDTGRARYSWFCTVGSPSHETPPEGNYNPPDASSRAGAVGNGFSIHDVLYITNNVPYIKRLNDGYSKQAPARFVERAAHNAEKAAVAWLKQQS